MCGVRTRTDWRLGPLSVGLAPPDSTAPVASLTVVRHLSTHAEVRSYSNGICDIAWISACNHCNKIRFKEIKFRNVLNVIILSAPTGIKF